MTDRSNPLRYKQNRLQQLRGFCYTAQTGSITRAAEKMGLSQPSVSLQIQALERELKVVLLDRSGPRLHLTPDGELLFGLAARLVEGLDALPQTFASRRGSLKEGRLDIAAGESTILYILPRFLQQFTQKYPGIDIVLHNVTGRDGLAMLRRGQAELAIGSMLEVPEDIVYLPSFSYDPMLITPLRHPLSAGAVTLKRISEYPMILPPRHLTTWRVVSLAFQKQGLPLQVRLEAGGWEVIKKYVALGMGISIVTSVCLTDEDHRRLRSIPLNRFFPKRTYGIVLRRNKYLSAQAECFLDLMDRRARKALATPGTIGASGMSKGGFGILDEQRNGM